MKDGAVLLSNFDIRDTVPTSKSAIYCLLFPSNYLPGSVIYCGALDRFFEACDSGVHRLADGALIQYLYNMLRLPYQGRLLLMNISISLGFHLLENGSSCASLASGLPISIFASLIVKCIIFCLSLDVCATGQ